MNCSCRIFDAVKEFKSIVNKFAFNPPQNCLYTINYIYSLDSIYQAKEYEKVSFQHTTYNTLPKYFPHITESSYILYHQSEGEKTEHTIALLYLQTYSPRFTILYSHGNSSSLGTIYPFLYDIATQFKCNIVSYDYSGYGQSQGTPSEDMIKSNVTSVYKFMRDKLAIEKEKIIVMGHSIGSFPSVHIAEHKPSIAGLILISPIASGKMYTNDKGNDYKGIDIFSNARKIKKVQCPLLLIHGKGDKDISYAHSVTLLKNANCQKFKWFPINANHKNIYDKYRMNYIKKVKKFLDFCSTSIQNRRNSKNSISSIISESELSSNKSYGNRIRRIDSEDDIGEDMEERKINIGDSDEDE